MATVRQIDGARPQPPWTWAEAAGRWYADTLEDSDGAATTLVNLMALLRLYDDGTFGLYDCCNTHDGTYRFTDDQFILVGRASSLAMAGPDHPARVLITALNAVRSSRTELVSRSDNEFVVTSRGWTITFRRYVE